MIKGGKRTMMENRVPLFLGEVVVMFPPPGGERVGVSDGDGSTKFDVSKTAMVPLGLGDGATKGEKLEEGFRVTTKVVPRRVRG